MAFKLKSGNTTNFKSMGSSPAKNMKTGSYGHSFESPAKQKVNMNDPKVEANYVKHKDNPKYRAALDKKSGGKFEYDKDSRTSTVSTPAKQITKEGQARLDEQAKRKVSHKSYLDKNDNKSKFKKDTKGVLRNVDGKSVGDMNPKSPAKQKLNKDGEGQDQDKIFDDNGKHVANWVDGKKRAIETKLGPRVKKSTESAHGQLNDAEREYQQDLLDRKKKKKSPAKQKVDPPRSPGDRGVKVRYDNETQKYVPIGTPRKIKSTPEIEIKRPAKRKATIPGDFPRMVRNKVVLKPLDPQFNTRDIQKKKKSPAKQAKTKGLGPSTAFGGVKNPELVKSKPRHPGRKVMKDGPKNKVHGIDLGKDPHWQPHQFRSPRK